MQCPGQVYVFGDFRLDPRRRTLSSRKTGAAIPLPASSLDLLIQLVEHPGALISRQTLLASIWPHATVVDNSVNQAVAAIRGALGDGGARPTFLETVRGRGYRFLAEVKTEGPAGRDPKTFQLYVAGWSALTRPGPTNLTAAQGFFEQAIARDPDFSLAMVCLGETLIQLGAFGVRPPHVALPRANEVLMAALKSDPFSAEAHALLSQIAFIYDHDLERAQLLIAQAFELDPANFIAHRVWGMQLSVQGRFEDALAATRRAQSFEPLAVHINGNIGAAYYLAGKFDEAIAQFEHTLHMDGSWAFAQSLLTRSYLCLGQFDRALDCFPGGASSWGLPPDRAIAYALSGSTDEARRELARLTQRPDDENIPPLHFVNIHAALGDYEAALVWVKRVIEQRVNAAFIAFDPLLRDLREDSRVIQLLERTGLGPLLESRQSVEGRLKGLPLRRAE